MRKLVLLFFIAVLWFSDMKELISQSSGEGTLYYFTLHPGIVYQNDSLVTMLISSQNESQIYIEKNNEYLPSPPPYKEGNAKGGRLKRFNLHFFYFMHFL